MSREHYCYANTIGTFFCYSSHLHPDVFHMRSVFANTCMLETVLCIHTEEWVELFYVPQH